MQVVEETVETGGRAPEFKLPSGSGATVALADYRGKSSVVLYFVREFACMTCQLHAAALVRMYAQIQASGADVLVIGGGSPGDAAKMAKRIAAPFPVLADADRTVYDKYNLPKALGLFQRSATFVIDPHGIVRYATRSTNPQFGIRIGELLEALKQPFP